MSSSVLLPGPGLAVALPCLSSCARPPPLQAWLPPCLFCDCPKRRVWAGRCLAQSLGGSDQAWLAPPQGPLPTSPSQAGSPSACPAEAGPGSVPWRALCDAVVAMATLGKKAAAFRAWNPLLPPALLCRPQGRLPAGRLSRAQILLQSKTLLFTPLPLAVPSPPTETPLPIR